MASSSSDMDDNSSSDMEDHVSVEEIEEIGRRLISLPSSRFQQLHLLDRVENVLRRVEQSPPQAVIEALKPIMKALVADIFLKNYVRDVKISVASCISQVMRITAPDSPYSDEELKIYFQVSVSAFEELWSLPYQLFTKVVSILKSFAELKSCVLMLDLELDTEIVKMFRNLFYCVGPNLSPESFYSERTIMTLVIEESEELPDEIIMLLLDNLKMENRKAQPLAWELGVEILKNCGATLKKYIPKAVEVMSLDLNDFAEVVASICQDFSRKQNSEAAPEATDCEKASGSTTLTKNSTDSNGKRDDTSKAKKSSKKSKSTTRSKQRKSSKNIDTSKENEDERPITAVLKEINSRSKISAKGESSKKTNKKLRTQSEIIGSTAEEMKAGVDTTEVQLQKRKQRTEGEEMISSSEAPPVDMTGFVRVTPESETRAVVEVRGYMVKASIADTLEGIFSKYGDIASNCPYKSPSIKAYLLEVVCTMLQKLQNEDSLPDFNEVESIINDADKAELKIGWLRMELEKRVAHKAGLNVEMLRGTRRQVLHAAKAAKSELKHRRAELEVAQKRIEEVERCFNALRCVQNKFKDDILELEESRKKRSKMV